MSSFIFYPSGNIQFHDLTWDFYHEASGNLCCLGRCSAQKTSFIVTKFHPGDIAYNARKAALGILEAIAVKRIVISFKIMYIDTYNSYWNEDMLVDQATAFALVLAFNEQQDMFRVQIENQDRPPTCQLTL